MKYESKQSHLNHKPNIVLLMTDQQKASAMGAYGNPLSLSPFQDRMADEGFLFKNAYASSPICTPSRASMMTGVQPLVNDCTCHQNRVPFNLPQLAELLQQSDYYTMAAGHYESLRNLDRGWHEQADLRDAGPLNNAWVSWISHGRKDVGWSSGTIDIDADNGHSALLTDRSIRMIDNAHASQKPFFLHIAYNDPHPPYFVPKPFDKYIDPGEVDLYPNSDIDGRPLWQFKCLSENGTEKATESDLRKVKAIYYGMIAYANSQMERIYQELKQRGMLKNTWFIIASDHGDYTGEKGLFTKTESLYECLLHVPLVIRPPDDCPLPLQRGQSFHSFVDTTDIFSTILGLAGASIPDYAQGYDLIDWIIKGAKYDLRDRVYSQVGNYHGFLKTSLPGGIPESGRHFSLLQGVRTHKFSYICDPDYGDEAYDLQNDPYELNNLFNPGRPKPPEEVYELKASIDRWNEKCKAIKNELGIIPGDRGFVEGWE